MSVFIEQGNGTVKELFKGCVLADREKNYYDDSDFYVIAWDEEKGKLVEYEYATTRFYCAGCYASVDATPEVIAKASVWAYKTFRKDVWRSYLNGLRKPNKGDKVRVVSGRKVKKGTEGVLFWVGAGESWSRHNTVRCGIAVTDRKDDSGRYVDVQWTYMHNITVADPRVHFSLKAAKDQLRRLKRNSIGFWRHATSPLMVA